MKPKMNYRLLFLMILNIFRYKNKCSLCLAINRAATSIIQKSNLSKTAVGLLTRSQCH